MLEKSVIATAQIVEPGFAICSADDAIFGTFAVAGKEKFALAALPGQRALLLLAELALAFAIHHLGERGGVDIAQSILRKHKVVATVDVAVILHHAGMAALLGKAAHTGLHAHPVGKCRVEYLHEYLAHIFLHPLVEQAAEKIAPLLGTHREVGKASVTLVGCCQMASVVVLEYALHYGRKLQVVASHILEKTVKFHGIIGIVVVDHRHSVPLHSVFIE